MEEQYKGEVLEAEPVSQVPEYVIHEAAEMIARGQDLDDVQSHLMESGGMPEYQARDLANQLESEIREAKNAGANKDMLYGALWCIGGTVATLADIGFIFWGAILFGAIQFIKGAASRS